MISLQDYGLLCALSRRAEWTSSEVAGVGQAFGASRQALNKSMQHCIEAGHVRRVAARIPGQRGFRGFHYLISQDPLSEDQWAVRCAGRPQWRA